MEGEYYVKKSSFVAMILGTVSIVLFALGMCMALLPEWDSFNEGIIFGAIGLVLCPITLLIWRKMENKAPIKINGKSVLFKNLSSKRNRFQIFVKYFTSYNT